MKKKIIKVLSALLVVVITLTSTPLSGFIGLELPDWLDYSIKANAITEDDMASAQEVSLDETIVVDSGTEGIYIKFTPTEYYGTYRIYSDNGDNGNDCDPYVQLYDANGNLVASNDDDDTYSDFNKNFSLYFYANPYDTYYFYIGSFENNTSFNFSIMFYDYETIYDLIDGIDYNFGTCGENIKWKFDDYFSSLDIYGTGPMPSYPAWYGFDDETKYVFIEDGITTICDYAFKDFTNLEYIEIPSCITSIGEQAFSYCESLESISIPNKVTSIGERAFERCGSLTSVNLGNGVTSIGEEAFTYCTKITSIEIPEGVTTINDNTFYHCDWLKSATLPDSVTTIGDYAFCETSLTSVTIPDSVTSIGEHAFAFCRNLESVTIPASVTSIGEEAFHYNKSATSFTVDSNNQYYSSDEYGVLFNKDKTTLIQHPIGNTRTSYIIPNSVTKICDFAFFYSTNLTDIYYCGTEEQWNTIEVGSNNFSDELRYHKYASEVITYPTCTENGITTYTCELCGNSYEETTEPLGHDLVIDKEAVAPDCVNTGLTEGSHCSRCDYSVAQEEIPALGHDLVIDNEAVAPDCVNTGLTEGSHCSRCDYSVAQEEIPALGHNYDSVVTEPTCIEKGYTTYTCETCGDSYVADEVSAMGHTYEVTFVKQPSCMKDGYTKYTCSACEESYREVIPALNHTYEDGTSALVEIPAIEPTCTASGYTAGEVCELCNTKTIVPEQIPAVDHTWDDSVITQPSCTEGGYTTYTCSACGDTYTTDETEPLGHDMVVDKEAVAPDCTNTGLTEGSHCSRCDYTVAQEEIPALGHNYTTIINEPTCTEKGFTTYTCEACGDSYMADETDTIEHTYVDNYCSVCGQLNPEVCGDDLIWTFDESTGTLTISGTGDMYNFESYNRPWEDYEDLITSVTIEYGATTIGDGAFYLCRNLTSVTLPDSITTIGDDAFYLCTNLTSVTIPDSVTTIGDSAFKQSGIINIIIPDGVISIGNNAFKTCTGLTYISVDSNNKYYSSDENGVLFNRNKATLVQYPVGNAKTSYTIPDSVITISDSAFYGCSNLKIISIPDSVKSIDRYAFQSCNSLETLTIPNNVSTINSNAFSHCRNLTSVIIGNSITSIESSVFTGCTSLTEVIIPDSVISIGNGAFANCNSLTEVIIPDSVISIGNSAFSGCKSLTEVIIPDSVTSIGINVFANCTNVTKVMLHNSLTTISKRAFYNCTNLTEVYYCGTEEEWSIVEINTYNDPLLNAMVYYHKYVENGTVESTCIEDGYIIYMCELCDNEYHELIPATGHQYDLSFEQPPLCTDDGFKIFICSVCGVEYTETVAMTGHSYESKVTAPTCTEAGFTTFTCSVCDDTYVADETPATGHNYDTVVTAPTCTEKGYTTYTCLTCGDSYTADETEPIEHSAEKVERIDPTCTMTGLTEGYMCSVCDEILEPQITIPATGHDLVIDNEAVAPDCVNTGLTEGSHCSRCDYSVAQEEIPALGHNYSNVETTATCTESGVTIYTCEVCNDSYSEETDALGHNYNAVVTAPTCTEKGYTTYICSGCGDTYIADETEALGHTKVTVQENRIESTPTTYGSYVEVVRCSLCEMEFSRTTVTLPLSEAKVSFRLQWDKEYYLPGDIAYLSVYMDAAEYLSLYTGGITIGLSSSVFDPTISEHQTEGLSASTIPSSETFFSYYKDPSTQMSQLSAAQVNNIKRYNTDEENFLYDWYIRFNAAKNPDGEHENVGNTTNGFYAYDFDPTEPIIVIPLVFREDIEEGTCIYAGITSGSLSTTAKSAIGTAWRYYSSPDVTTTSSFIPSNEIDISQAVANSYIGEPHYKHILGEVVEVNRVEPSCTMSGYYENVYYCAICGEEFDYEWVEIPPLGHTPDDPVEENHIAATCTTDGSYENVYYCTVCGEELYREAVQIPATGHDYRVYDVLPPTCTEAGYTEYRCWCCEDSYISDVIDAQGHSIGEPVTENHIDATCTTDGSYENVYYCTVCGEELYREAVQVPATGHNYDSVVTAPTCTQSGFTTYTCSACGDSYIADETESIEHSYVDGTCTGCGKNKMILEVMTSQIRFSINDTNEYLNKFDVRTRVKISDENFKELVAVSNDKVAENVDKIGFVYTLAGENFSAESAQTVATGGSVAGYVDAPVKYIQDADGYYMFTCLIKDIPDSDREYTLTAYAYICINGKWYFSEEPMNADFNNLYSTYYPLASEKYGWEA